MTGLPRPVQPPPARRRRTPSFTRPPPELPSRGQTLTHPDEGRQPGGEGTDRVVGRKRADRRRRHRRQDDRQDQHRTASDPVTGPPERRDAHRPEEERRRERGVPLRQPLDRTAALRCEEPCRDDRRKNSRGPRIRTTRRSCPPTPRTGPCGPAGARVPAVRGCGHSVSRGVRIRRQRGTGKPASDHGQLTVNHPQRARWAAGCVAPEPSDVTRHGNRCPDRPPLRRSEGYAQ